MSFVTSISSRFNNEPAEVGPEHLDFTTSELALAEAGLAVVNASLTAVAKLDDRPRAAAQAAIQNATYGDHYGQIAA